MNFSDLGLPIPVGGSGGVITISKQLYFANLNSGLNYDIDTSAAFAYTLTQIRKIQTLSGTVTATVKINGTSVPGLTNISVSSSPADWSVTAGSGTVAIGNRVQIVFASNVAAININLTLAATRNI